MLAQQAAASRITIARAMNILGVREVSCFQGPIRQIQGSLRSTRTARSTRMIGPRINEEYLLTTERARKAISPMRFPAVKARVVRHKK